MDEIAWVGESFEDAALPEPPRDLRETSRWIVQLARVVERVSRSPVLDDGIDPGARDTLERLATLQAQCAVDIRRVGELLAELPGLEPRRAIVLVRDSWDLARRLEQRKRWIEAGGRD